MLAKVISGGQTGADRAGLIAAKAAGITTGGWMPREFKALDGNHPEFAELFGIREHPSPEYPPRTHKNAAESDGTVRFARKWNSRGEICTLNAIKKAKKKYFDIDVPEGSQPDDLVGWLHETGGKQPAALVAWLRENKIRTLNVAGNTEKDCPGIGHFVEKFLEITFRLLRE
jgi:hypothetical protein